MDKDQNQGNIDSRNNTESKPNQEIGLQSKDIHSRRNLQKVFRVMGLGCFVILIFFVIYIIIVIFSLPGYG